MESMDEVRKHYGFAAKDEENLKELSAILSPYSGNFAEAFYDFLIEDPHLASFFKTDAAIQKRKETISAWFKDVFAGPYNNLLLMRLQRIGEVHVKIGLKGHYVNSAMNFVRSYCIRQTAASLANEEKKADLLETLNKVLDLNLDVITSSYREAELKKVFLSYKAESVMIRWSDRLLHGLNIVLLVGLIAMAVGVVSLLVYDIHSAFTSDFQNGVIKALGSLLILWMIIELLHTQMDVLKGGKFHVRIFLELALVAFIRKLFVASVESKDAVTFGVILGGTFVLGIILYLLAKADSWQK
jgi:uncharacterized membrane protein (DUF373 family)/truncated hemoglobin YjbI